MFQPQFTLTPRAVKALIAIEADRQVVANLPLTARMLDSLRRTARLLSTHLSTQIEGNRLSAAQVEAVMEGEGGFPGRERDEAEVRNYFAGLEHVELLGRQPRRLVERDIKIIHGLVMSGKARPTPCERASAGSNDRHVRTALGISEMPLDASVQISMWAEAESRDRARRPGARTPGRRRRRYG
jgi:Fic family protein